MMNDALLLSLARAAIQQASERYIIEQLAVISVQQTYTVEVRGVLRLAEREEPVAFRVPLSMDILTPNHMPEIAFPFKALVSYLVGFLLVPEGTA